MHNTKIAEWVLSLVTAPDRAATAVGDLIEESEHRGTVWFWWNLVVTAAFHVWRELRDGPISMLLLALSGMAEFAVIGVIAGIAVINGWMSLAPYPYASNAFFIPPWGYRGLLLFLDTALPLFIGWEVARRSRGREIAAGIAMIAISMLIPAVTGREAGIRVHGGPYPHLEYRLNPYALAFVVMAGAICRRILRIRRDPPHSLVA